MNCLRRLPFSHCLSSLVFFGALLTMACDRQETQSSEEVQTFTGKWTATGSRQTMQLEPGHGASNDNFQINWFTAAGWAAASIKGAQI
jgi:hypothetical protein